MPTIFAVGAGGVCLEFKFSLFFLPLGDGSV